MMRCKYIKEDGERCKQETKDSYCYWHKQKVNDYKELEWSGETIYVCKECFYNTKPGHGDPKEAIESHINSNHTGD